MEVTVNLDNKGISLIEVLIALTVFLLILLGLLHGLTLSTDVNIRNRLRDEAVKIAKEEIECTRNLAFGSINDTLCIDNTNKIVTRSFGNYNAGYCLSKIPTPSGNVKKIEVRVHWNYKNLENQYSCENNNYDYRITKITIVRS